MEVEDIECLEVQCEEHNVSYEYLDTRTGEQFDGEKVREVCNEEIKELERRGYVTAKLTECWEKTGKPPIGVRWVDVHRGECVYRSRLVAKDFKTKGKVGDMEGLYGEMPPLKLVKHLLVEAARSGKDIMLIDYGKAHLCAPVEGEVYVDLRLERHEVGKCATAVHVVRHEDGGE